MGEANNWNRNRRFVLGIIGDVISRLDRSLPDDDDGIAFKSAGLEGVMAGVNCNYVVSFGLLD